MRKLLFNILSIFSNLLPLKLLIYFSGKKVIFPFYHIVCDQAPPHIKHLYKVRSVKTFKKDIKFYQKYYKSLNSIPKNISDTKEKSFLLTFDDGLKEFFTVILPILKESGLQSIIFINTGFVDNKGLFFKYKISLLIDKLISSETNNQTIKDLTSILNIHKKTTKKNIADKLLKLTYQEQELIDLIANILKVDFIKYTEMNSPYLSKNQIKYILKEGFKIGAHSIDHPLYSDLTINEQINQTQKSIEDNSDNFEITEKYFAFPFTDKGLSKEYFEYIYNVLKINYSFGTAGIKDDFFERNIQRIPIEKYKMSAKRIVKTEYLSYILKVLINKRKIIRQ